MTSLLATIFHIILTFVFVYLLDWGFLGICWSTFGYFFIRMVLNVAQCSLSSDVPAVPDVHFFSKETVSNLGPLININFTSGIMGVWQIWSLDIFTLMASQMPVSKFAAQSIMRNIGQFTILIPMTSGGSILFLTGNAVGQKNKNKALLVFSEVAKIAGIAWFLQTLFLMIL